MLVLNAHGYSLPRSEPIHVPNKLHKMLMLPLSNATNRTQIGSEMAKNKHLKILLELWISLYSNIILNSRRSLVPRFHTRSLSIYRSVEALGAITRPFFHLPLISALQVKQVKQAQ